MPDESLMSDKESTASSVVAMENQRTQVEWSFLRLLKVLNIRFEEKPKVFLGTSNEERDNELSLKEQEENPELFKDTKQPIYRLQDAIVACNLEMTKYNQLLNPNLEKSVVCSGLEDAL